MIFLTPNEKAVLDIIRGHNSTDKIYDREIRNQVHVDDPAEKMGAGLRRVINSLRQKGFPICSDTRGYWYASTKEELIENVEALRGRAIKILQAADGMKKAVEMYDEINAKLF